MNESGGETSAERTEEAVERRRLLRLATLKRETRFGIAIVLSFAILMAVLVMNRPAGSKAKTKDETKANLAQAKPPEKAGPAGSGKPPVTQIPAPSREELAASEPKNATLPPGPIEPGPGPAAIDPLDAPPGPVPTPATGPATDLTTLAGGSDSPPPPPAAQPRVEDPLAPSDPGPPPGPVATSTGSSTSGIPLPQPASPAVEPQPTTTAMNPPDTTPPAAAIASPQPHSAPRVKPSPVEESPSPAPVAPTAPGSPGRPSGLDPPPPQTLPSNLVERAHMPRVGEDWVPVPNAGKNLDGEPRPLPPAIARNTAPTRLASTSSPAPGAAAASAAPADLDPIEPARHVVQSGENFWTISKLYYGSARYYKALWAANRDRVVAPDKLAVGMAIRVPPPEALDRSLIEVVPLGGTEPPSDRRPSRAAGRTTRSRGASEVELALPVGRRASRPTRDVADAHSEVSYPTHEVREHETLRSIARDTLGDARRASEILEMNRDSIPDPKHLVPGQQLVLPDDAQLTRASTRSRN